MQYRVKNWERFQHYKDRNPPWIKLHFEMLSSTDWVTLDDASRVLAIACMLIASRNEGNVPGDPHYMRRVAYLNKIPNFKPLLDCGFLEKPQADASVLLADASTLQADARPETETYREYSKETETESKSTHTKVSKMPFDFIPLDWKAWLIEEKGWSEEIMADVWSLFLDYWKNGKGKNTRRSNWLPTFRSWCRKENYTSVPKQSGFLSFEEKAKHKTDLAIEEARKKYANPS